MPDRVSRVRLRDIWPFGKPKTPGFGISRDFYLSVLCARADLPRLIEVINPEGQGGAVRGFGAPLSEGKDKESLLRPMTRGGYVLASLDRKTVLKGLVIPHEESGFDPVAFDLTELAARLDPETRLRIRSTWSLVQLTFEAHHPMVYPSLDLLLDLAERLGRLTDGIVADPLSEVYRRPEEVRALPPLEGPVDARNFVSVRLGPPEPAPDRPVSTAGLRKFALPEIEMRGVHPDLDRVAIGFLTGLAQTILLKGPIELGAQVGAAGAPLQVAAGGADRARWEGIAVYELVPARGRTVDECLEIWGRESGLGREETLK